MLSRPHAPRGWVSWKLAVPAAVAALMVMVALDAPSGAGVPVHDMHHAGMSMTDADMQQMLKSWWATHPLTGVPSKQLASATFMVQNFIFNLDANLATQIDTAKISVGESVTWQWINGSHTITSGTGFDDPNAGLLFDRPMDTTNRQFTFVFNTAGTYPFFCIPHEFSEMKGVVVVSSPLGVDPKWNGQGLGFIVAPSPNPTLSGVTFQFALQRAGQAQAEVFDTRGRLVARVLDQRLDAGTHTASWDGRSSSGTRAGPGIYYLRLRVPGLTDSRRIVVAR